MSLVEVVVGLFVIALGLVSLVPLQLRSAQTIGLAHERQQATALTEAALEQVRDAAADPARAAALLAGGPAYSGSDVWSVPAGETLLTSATPDSSLDQTVTVSVPAFTTRLYVTARGEDPSGTLWITGVTGWTSSNGAGQAEQVVVRSLLHARTS